MVRDTRRGTKFNFGSGLVFCPRFPEPWRCCPKTAMYTFVPLASERMPRFLHGLCGVAIPRGAAVIGKQYFVRQATILFWIAKATKDPNMSAALMDKAADVKSRVDELGAPLDLTPLAPDVEPPPAK